MMSKFWKDVVVTTVVVGSFFAGVGGMIAEVKQPWPQPDTAAYASIGEGPVARVAPQPAALFAER
jgi:hypothetical protein